MRSTGNIGQWRAPRADCVFGDRREAMERMNARMPCTGAGGTSPSHGKHMLRASRIRMQKKSKISRLTRGSKHRSYQDHRRCLELFNLSHSDRDTSGFKRSIVADIVISSKTEETESNASRHLMELTERHRHGGEICGKQHVPRANGVMIGTQQLGEWSRRI